MTLGVALGVAQCVCDTRSDPDCPVRLEWGLREGKQEASWESRQLLTRGKGQGPAQERQCSQGLELGDPRMTVIQA